MNSREWKRFEKTGKIEDYLIYKEKKQVDFDVCQGKRDNNKRSPLP